MMMLQLTITSSGSSYDILSSLTPLLLQTTYLSPRRLIQVLPLYLRHNDFIHLALSVLQFYAQYPLKEAM